MNELVFLYGAERSGTTVFKNMLDAHDNISCPGGVDFIFQYLKKSPSLDKWTCDVEGLRRDWAFQAHNLDILEFEDGKDIALNLINQFLERSKRYLVLLVHRQIEKVAAIFPDAKIIHLIRDPRDVAFSCIGMGWAGNVYYAIDGWLQTENDWDNFGPTFRKDRVLKIFYKDLISSTEIQLEEICKFIGVSFSPEMLNYPLRSNYSAPDPSLIGQWKKRPARDVALVEVRTKRLLLQRYYELSGYPLDPPGLTERIYLWLTNKIYVWKFGLCRYGSLNFVMEKITRKFARRLHTVFHQRMYEIWKQNLK